MKWSKLSATGEARRFAVPVAPVLAFLVLATVALGLPTDLPAQRQDALAHVQTSVSQVASARELSLKANKEVDRLDMEILKRQQGVLTARRSGDSVSAAEDELALSKDKLRLAQARATAASFELSSAQTRQALAETQLQKLEVEQESVGAGNSAALETKRAEFDKRLSTLQNDLAGQAAQGRAAEQAASLLAQQLEAKWGSKFTGKKPEPQRVYKADPAQTPEPEEATEL